MEEKLHKIWALPTEPLDPSKYAFKVKATYDCKYPTNISKHQDFCNFIRYIAPRRRFASCPKGLKSTYYYIVKKKENGLTNQEAIAVSYKNLPIYLPLILEAINNLTL